jgi:hypothetical protein
LLLEVADDHRRSAGLLSSTSTGTRAGRSALDRAPVARVGVFPLHIEALVRERSDTRSTFVENGMR